VSPRIDTVDIVRVAGVAANRKLCREHYRLTLTAGGFRSCAPGQFVHISPAVGTASEYRVWDESNRHGALHSFDGIGVPLLRRAFSIAGLRQTAEAVEIDVIYRVVGTATRWMASLEPGDSVSCMGPLGNAFAISGSKPVAWLVAGGVGLPPMLWLAEALHRAGKRAVAFCGARSADLLPLTLDPDIPPASDAQRAVASASEFAAVGASVVISTDDGTAGFHGHIGAALSAYARANPATAGDVVVYACGPERMMQSVADYAIAHSVECYVCMERNMGCGTGMCQSCVVPLHDQTAPDAWRYALCCTEGPVFDARRIIWEAAPAFAGSP
jgi:dihydroorotate dehydrogenase electron transfer subunit